MSKWFLCVLFTALMLSLNAQIKDPELPSNLRHFITPKIQFNQGDSNTIFVKMGFNDALTDVSKMNIDASRIESVTLVYTKYKLSETFSQADLNKKRMIKLQNMIPGLKENKGIQWLWYEQTGCNDPEKCKDYYHGFVITLSSPDVIERRLTEIGLLDYYASYYEGLSDSKYMDSMIEIGKIKMVKKCDTIEIRQAIKGNRLPRPKNWSREETPKLLKYLGKENLENDTIQIEYEYDVKGEFTQLLNASQYPKAKKISRFLKNNSSCIPGRINNIKTPNRVSAKIYKYKFGYKVDLSAIPIINNDDTFDYENFLFVVSRTIVCDYLDTSMLKVGTGILSSTQNIIPAILDRNKQWKNCLIVTDVTGSMFPYLAQFQMWHKLNLTNSNHKDFVFFNDGDNLPDVLKKTGQVGGLYYLQTLDYEELIVTMKTAMLKGNGGDIPENNLEAVLEGLKQNPSIKEVIMIADNKATPRDLELLSKIKVPIHLILCGTQKGINPDYLNLIRKNKGSIHTIEEDIIDLSTIREGQIIKIDGKTYKLKNGQFVRL